MSDATPLFEAIRNGDVGAVQSLVAADPSLASAKNASGVSAVLFSVYTGRREIRDVLLAQGATLELHDAAAVGDLARLEPLVAANPALAKSHSPDGFPVVALASVFGHLETARCLAAHGADINAVATNGSGYTALTGAVAGGHTEVVAWLLAQGADPNYRYAAGYSPLLTAAANGHLAIVELLLAHGADPRAVTNEGKTAVVLAAERKHPEVAAVLQAQSAS
jgi:ankyrin repeat protein